MKKRLVTYSTPSDLLVFFNDANRLTIHYPTLANESDVPAYSLKLMRPFNLGGETEIDSKNIIKTKFKTITKVANSIPFHISLKNDKKNISYKPIGNYYAFQDSLKLKSDEVVGRGDSILADMRATQQLYSIPKQTFELDMEFPKFVEPDRFVLDLGSPSASSLYPWIITPISFSILVEYWEA